MMTSSNGIIFLVTGLLGIHRGPVNSPHKGQWCGALTFSLICVWINSRILFDCQNQLSFDWLPHCNDITWVFWCLRSYRWFVEKLIQVNHKAIIKGTHYWPFVRGILHEALVIWKLFLCHDVIMWFWFLIVVICPGLMDHPMNAPLLKHQPLSECTSAAIWVLSAWPAKWKVIYFVMVSEHTAMSHGDIDSWALSFSSADCRHSSLVWHPDWFVSLLVFIECFGAK